jgi:hypothetical protein
MQIAFAVFRLIYPYTDEKAWYINSYVRYTKSTLSQINMLQQKLNGPGFIHSLMLLFTIGHSLFLLVTMMVHRCFNLPNTEIDLLYTY